MSRVLIVPDKFKGTLTAEAVSSAITAGWSDARPNDSIARLPMSDGGDGFGEVLASLCAAQPRTVRTVDAAQQPLDATWWWVDGRQLAIVESARVVGLALLPPGKFHPFNLDTFGLGALLKAALESGARDVLVGIGGSATNDGGFGLARALGWRFFDGAGQLLETWTKLERLSRIIAPAQRVAPGQVLVAVDVQNPLLGPSGASRVYGPQKGLRSSDFEFADACLGRMAEVFAKDFGGAFALDPGSGAAGGLGFGLCAFANARMQSGFELFAEYSRLRDRIRSVDLVITGEGALDRSSFMGKGVGEIVRLCRKNRVDCLALAGCLSAAALPEPESPGAGAEPVSERLPNRSAGFRAYGVVPGLTSVDESRRAPGEWLRRLAARAAAEWCAEGGTALPFS